MAEQPEVAEEPGPVAEQSGPVGEQSGPVGQDSTVAGQEIPEDPLRRPILDLLRTELGEGVVGFQLAAGDDLWVRVDRSVWRRAAELCRDRLDLNYFCFLSSIDWMPNPDLLGEKAWEAPGDGSPGAVAADEDEEDLAGTADEAAVTEEVTTGHVTTGVAGGDTRFQVLARLYNPNAHVGVTLKVDLAEDDPRVDSWVPVFRGADWHEREAWEMYGFVFDDHPGLRHLYLPSEFEGHPLRKDFPLLARLVKPWPGLVDVEPLPGEDGEDGQEGTEDGAATAPVGEEA